MWIFVLCPFFISGQPRGLSLSAHWHSTFFDLLKGESRGNIIQVLVDNGHSDMLTLQIKHFSQSTRARKIALWALSIGFLFFGFFSNVWHVAEQEWFDTHQRDTESLIIGRMVKSRQDGIFSVGGLTGAGVTTNIQQDWISANQIDNQYAAYLNRGSFDKFSPYMSQTGGQGIIFSLLDRCIPLSPQIKLWSFYVLTALLSAITLTAMIGWFYEEFGGWVAIFVVGSAVLSQWLTVFGKNLWWSLWAFYLPMIVVMSLLKRHRGSVEPSVHQVWNSDLHRRFSLSVSSTASSILRPRY